MTKSAVKWARKIVGPGSSQHNGRGSVIMKCNIDDETLAARVIKFVKRGKQTGDVVWYKFRKDGQYLIHEIKLNPSKYHEYYNKVQLGHNSDGSYGIVHFTIPDELAARFKD